MPPMNSLTVRPAEIFAMNIPDLGEGKNVRSLFGHRDFWRGLFHDSLSAITQTATTEHLMG